MKKCAKCNYHKLESEYHKDKNRPDGLFSYCKSCRKYPKKEKKYRTIDEVLSNFTKSESGCWNWRGTINIDGYGMACYMGQRVRAHRLSLLNSLGIDKSELLALHHCDNRKCINPNHLYLGTSKDNSNDMVLRCRANPRTGSESNLSKINEDQAISIFNDDRKHREISDDYGISESAVSSIKTGRNWSHATKR